jgi:hypothetical protein
MNNHRIKNRLHNIKCNFWVSPLIFLLVACSDGASTGEAVKYPDVDTDAATLFIEKCGQCHAAPRPASHVAERWPGIMERMQMRMTSKSIQPLNQREFAIVLEYLQAHAKWYNDIEFVVEIRPGPPRVGMNEFIIVATHKDRKPAHEFVVSLKMQGVGEWRQSIQDGHSGVYRRAIRINDPAGDILLVQVKRGDQEAVLSFPVSHQKNESTKS